MNAQHYAFYSDCYKVYNLVCFVGLRNKQTLNYLPYIIIETVIVQREEYSGFFPYIHPAKTIDYLFAKEREKYNLNLKYTTTLVTLSNLAVFPTYCEC